MKSVLETIQGQLIILTYLAAIILSIIAYFRAEHSDGEKYRSAFYRMRGDVLVAAVGMYLATIGLIVSETGLVVFKTFGFIVAGWGFYTTTSVLFKFGYCSEVLELTPEPKKDEMVAASARLS